jgi:hypothetical protein
MASARSVAAGSGRSATRAFASAHDCVGNSTSATVTPMMPIVSRVVESVKTPPLVGRNSSVPQNDLVDVMQLRRKAGCRHFRGSL